MGSRAICVSWSGGGVEWYQDENPDTWRAIAEHGALPLRCIALLDEIERRGGRLTWVRIYREDYRGHASPWIQALFTAPESARDRFREIGADPFHPMVTTRGEYYVDTQRSSGKGR
jgi:hypothetical protein